MQSNSCTLSRGSKAGGVLFGLLLLMAGLLFLSFNLGWIDPALKPVLFSWPMIFVVIGIIGFPGRNRLLSLFWLILGGFFLLPRIEVAYPGTVRGVDGDFVHTCWPLLLILFGAGVILHALLTKKGGGRRNPLPLHATGDGRVCKQIIFGGSESIFLDPVFCGGEISIIFGGVELDLRRTQLPEGDTHLNINVIFGGVELHIPADWQIEVKAIRTICGGIDDRRPPSPVDKSRKLVIDGDILFGGCELR
ncbi:MAG: cell wall-active antibiotics response protein [Proteiniphilum sp.]|nr:cell wall-active antibiotics response protein [Proteiniphilum sp.]